MNDISTVTVILSVSTAVLPILFGYVVYRMSQIFITKTEFLAYQKNFEKDASALKEEIDEIKRNTLELLQRTAHMRNNK